MFLLVGIVLLLVLPSDWNIVLFAACLALFLGELAFWNRRVRDRSAQAGAETLLGRTATVVSACHPDGQVRLAGEIWEASCTEGADLGDTVVVTAREDLKLVVARPTSA